MIRGMVNSVARLSADLYIRDELRELNTEQ